MADYKSTRSMNDSQDDVGQTQSFASAQKEKKEQQHESSKKATKVIAKGAAMYAGGPEAGAAVDMAAKTKAGDKILNKGADVIDKNPALAKAAKKLDDSGITDKADQALSLAGGMNGGAGAAASQGGQAANAANGANAANQATAAQNASKAGGASTELGGGSSGTGGGSSFLDNAKDMFNPFKGRDDDNKPDDQQQGDDSVLSGKIKVPAIVKVALISMAPIIIIVLLIAMIISIIGGVFADFTEALGISQFLGLPAGSYSEVKTTEAEQRYYQRIKEVQEEYEKENKSVNVMYLVSVYHVANYHKHSIDYDYMTKGRIEDIADAMLKKETNDGETYYYYSEEYFRDNLTNKIFKNYFPLTSKSKREKYTNEVFEYIEKYYQMIEYNNLSTCSSSTACQYKIKGFYIYGRGNVAKNIDISNLKVRLMQSGIGNDHNYGGTFGQPLAGEELVDFEKYILGVAYAEIGAGAPDEAIKAQMVAARSYILARPTVMGGWRTLNQENGTWVLQTANSTQDQVYCNPDMGCSSNNGQWGMIHSGLAYNTGYSKQPLPAQSKMRSLAQETAGEVLVNSQGYIISSGYVQTEQNQMIALANKGYNYKQILFEIYNQGNRNYGASGVEKMTCNNSSDSCGITGDFVAWKQYQGPWTNVPMGNSGKNIRQIGCLVTSISIQIARSGVPTNIQGEFNPGSFVEYLNTHGGFAGGGNLLWAGVTKAAPSFKFVNRMSVSGYSRDQKLNTLANLINQGYYVVAEVKGNTGQHWVAVLSIDNGRIIMADPGSKSTDMWAQYNWANTSTFSYFKVA